MHLARVVRRSLLSALLVIALAAHGRAQEASSEELRLRPGDVLKITVWPQEELGGEFLVEETGFVYLPYLESVRVTELSLAELRRRLRDGYGQTLQNPVVGIQPLFRVSVFGSVRSPGVYLVSPTDQLTDVIGKAGGFGDNAKTEELRVVREGQVIEVNAKEALERGELLPLRALTLRSGDAIVVPARGKGISARTVFDIVRTALTVALLVDRLTE